MSPTEVRQAVAATGPRGAGRRYPPELRNSATELARDLLGAGVPLPTVAQELGIPHFTLQRWVAPATSTTTAMVPVRITPASSPTALLLRMPSGAVLEGLDLQSAVVVLRALQ